MQVEGRKIASNWQTKTVENRGQPVNPLQSTKLFILRNLKRFRDFPNGTLSTAGRLALSSGNFLPLFCAPHPRTNARIAGMCYSCKGRPIGS